MASLNVLRSLTAKSRRLLLYLRLNGFRWTANFLLHYLLGPRTKVFDRRMARLEARYGLPGLHSIRQNYEAWQNYNWEEGGEEWTVSPEWKRALIDEVLLRYIERGKTVLEIGPGAGRWTQALQKISKQLILVDISDCCIELCKKRFSHCNHIQFFVNEGRSLTFIPDESVDSIWSFAAFIHISPPDTESYLKEFHRILKKGGRAVINHPKAGSERGEWRSRVTTELFAQMVRNHKLAVIRQLDSWGDRGQFTLKEDGDMLTVFEK